MKAIVNVKPGTTYSKFNGLTFDVKNINNIVITLDLKGFAIEFSLGQVMICDIQEEYNKAYAKAEKTCNNTDYQKLYHIKEYAAYMDIKLDTVQL